MAARGPGRGVPGHGGRDSARMLHKNNLSESEATGSIWRGAALCGGRRCSEESFPCQLSTHLTIYLSAGEDGAILSGTIVWSPHRHTAGDQDMGQGEHRL